VNVPNQNWSWISNSVPAGGKSFPSKREGTMGLGLLAEIYAEQVRAMCMWSGNVGV
jgi:hypothetical protein